MRLASVTFLALFVFACGERTKSVEPRKPATTAASAEELPSPAGSGSAAPFLFTTRDGIGLSWVEPVANSKRVALRVAMFRGERWSAPRTIVEGDDLFVNWADFPSVVEDAKGVLFAHWLQKNGGGRYSYDVRMATSSDGGATWSESFLLNRDGRQGEHGFVTLAALPAGGISATWLDSRKMMMSDGDHDGHDAGDMTLRYATVDASGTLVEDVELDALTCECCGTGMAMTGSGPVIVYRDRSPDEIRDISYIRRNAGGWTVPRRVRADGWKIKGCPVNGPQIDATGDHAVTAWFTAANEQQRVYAAFSEDGGETFGEAIVIDDGKPAGRVDAVMLDSSTALVSWLEQTAAGAEIRARRIERDGTRHPAVKVTDASPERASGFTRIAKTADAVWLAWTERAAENKKIHLARLPFP